MAWRNQWQQRGVSWQHGVAIISGSGAQYVRQHLGINRNEAWRSSSSNSIVIGMAAIA